MKMKNEMNSRIVIEMQNVDHANKLIEFLKKLAGIGKLGGDLTVSLDGKKFNLGHDVNIKGCKHDIGKLSHEDYMKNIDDKNCDILSKW